MDNTAGLAESLRVVRQSFDRLPVIDFSGFSAWGDKLTIAKEVRWALTNVGFFYIKGSNLRPELQTEAFDMAKRFFALPEEVKRRQPIEQSGLALRGYTPLRGENTAAEVTQDLKEILDLGPHRTETTPFFGPNPDYPELPELAEFTDRYLRAMQGLSRRILAAIALSLDLPEDWFQSKVIDPVTILRMLHYPAQSGKIEEAEIGCGAHTDYGSLTLLLQDSNGGLQVRNVNGDWIAAPPVDGTFVINIGDVMQRLTGGLYLANLHRVINTSGKDRYSIPCFIDMDYNTEVMPLPGVGPKDYPSIVAGDHKLKRYRQSYSHL